MRRRACGVGAVDAGVDGAASGTLAAACVVVTAVTAFSAAGAVELRDGGGIGDDARAAAADADAVAGAVVVRCGTARRTATGREEGDAAVDGLETGIEVRAEYDGSVMRAEAAASILPPFLMRARRRWESGMAQLVTWRSNCIFASDIIPDDMAASQRRRQAGTRTVTGVCASVHGTGTTDRLVVAERVSRARR